MCALNRHTGHQDASAIRVGIDPTRAGKGSAEPERHLGDLGNVSIDAQGRGTAEILMPNTTLRPGQPNSVVGRSVVLHRANDDGLIHADQSGVAIACGIIEPE
jgi:Cu-Zn family superoxide dismutase